ncbi:MAG: glycine cleavage system protein GcvH [Bacteroidales bacterium]
MKLLENAKYAKSHEWVIVEGDKAKIGISDHAQHAMGNIVYISLPEEGDELEAGESFADVESLKAASEIYSPVTGEVTAVNEELNDSPALLNEDSYAAWIVEVKFSEISNDLMSAKEYEEYCNQAH